MPSTISLCMIVKDESDVLARCLMCVRDLVDEIVIVDTGSTDDTVAIARGFTDRVYPFAWVDDFAAARNAAFERATMDFVMWLDADDVMLPEDAERFEAMKAQLTPDIDVVMMPYVTAVDAHGNPTFVFQRERIVNRARGYRWHEPVHEYLDRGPNALVSDARILHDKIKGPASGRNLRIYEARLANGEALSPRGRYYYARELYYNGRYADAIAAFDAFLALDAAWIEDRIQACLLSARSAKRLGEDAMPHLLRALTLDVPRGEIACEIGADFLERGMWEAAAFWYEAALRAPTDRGGFLERDSVAFTPHIQLCVCYDRLGRRAEAIAHNEKAAAIKPDHASVAYNRAYFERTK